MAIFLTPESGGEPETRPPGQAEHQFREAATTVAQEDSVESKLEKLRMAVSRHFGDNGGGYDYPGPYNPGASAYYERTIGNSVIFRKGGKQFIADYEEDDAGNCTFDVAEEIQPTFTKVKGGETIGEDSEDD